MGVMVVVGSDREVYTLNPREERMWNMAARLARVDFSTRQEVLDRFGVVVGCSPEHVLADSEVAIAAECRRLCPERRSGGNWVTATICPNTPRPLLPNCPACYAVFGGGSLVYVGSTEDLCERMQEHGLLTRRSDGVATAWGVFAWVQVKYRPTIRRGDWAMVELRLIHRLQPLGNKKGIRPPAKRA